MCGVEICCHSALVRILHPRIASNPLPMRRGNIGKMYRVPCVAFKSPESTGRRISLQGGTSDLPDPISVTKTSTDLRGISEESRRLSNPSL
jgi:hypothetical protein